MTEQAEKQKTIPFYPDHVRTEALVVLGLVIMAFAIGAVALWNPIGLDAPADPMDTPAHAKPEWYFLFLYEILKYVPKTLGVVIPIVGLIIITIWPFLDRGEDDKQARTRRILASVVGMVAIVILTIMGSS